MKLIVEQNNMMPGPGDYDLDSSYKFVRSRNP